MGKAKKVKASHTVKKFSLEGDIQSQRFASSKNRNKIRLRQEEEQQVNIYFFYTKSTQGHNHFQFVTSDISRKILTAARQQQREIEGVVHTYQTEASTSSSLLENFDNSLDIDNESNTDDEDEETFQTESYFENIEINEDDEKAVEIFMNKNALPGKTLADIIMEKITEKHTDLGTQISDAGSIQIQDIDLRVKEMYEGVRNVLRKYRSGKLPKAFKIIPKLRNWEQILFITGL